MAKYIFKSFEVKNAMYNKIMVLWDLTAYSLVDRYQHTPIEECQISVAKVPDSRLVRSSRDFPSYFHISSSLTKVIKHCECETTDPSLEPMLSCRSSIIL